MRQLRARIPSMASTTARSAVAAAARASRLGPSGESSRSASSGRILLRAVSSTRPRTASTACAGIWTGSSAMRCTATSSRRASA